MALTTLPLIILSGAQGASLQGTIAFGDPSGMPSYFVWLFFLTTLITSFIMTFVSAWMLFTATYAYGSIEHNKQERRVAKHKNVV
jgi:heme/copper-type cytochrome/quinol oxidase subunit 2